MYVIDNSGKMVEVFSAEELARKVKQSIWYYEEQAKSANEKAQTTLLEAKQQVANSHKEENERLKERLKWSWGEFASEKEYKAFMKFRQEHMHNRAESKANGGKEPYIIPNYTGIGCAKDVVCQICGEKQDITDTEVW